MYWEFTDSQQLIEVLALNIVPEEIAHAETVTSRADDGRLWISVRGSLPRAVGRKLREIGVRAKRRMPVFHWWAAPGWWGAVPLNRLVGSEKIDPSQPVILQVPLGEELSRTLGEIERLGGQIETFQIRTDEGHTAFLKVAGLPYFSRLKALEPEASPRQRLYLERLPHVWIEAGYSHPLLERIPIPEGGLYFLAGSGRVATLQRNEFRAFGERDPLAISRGHVLGFHFRSEECLSIPLRLAARPAREPARFWIVEKQELKRWVEAAGQTQLEDLAVALWSAADPPLVLVRPLNEKLPPVLVWRAAGFQPSRIVPEVYLPLGYELHPSVRPEAIRAVLHCQPETLTWISFGEHSGFRVHAVSRSAFRPLREWVEYAIAQPVKAWQTWSPRLSWEFEPFEVLEDTKPRQRKSKRQFPVIDSDENTFRKDPPPKKQRPDRKASRTPASLQPAVPERPGFDERTARKRLAELQQSVLASDWPLGAVEEDPHWQEMARLHCLLGEAEEGMLCLSHAIWNPKDLDSDWLEAGWNQLCFSRGKDGFDLSMQQESGPQNVLAFWETLRKVPRPTGADLSQWALGLVWLSVSSDGAFLQDRLREMQEFLQRFEAELPLRVAWLAWHRLTQSASQDVLTLARARDRFLERLFHQGVHKERDCPRFLWSQSAADGRGLNTGNFLASFRPHLHRWSQSQTTKNNLQMTGAYLDLILAFGMARQGETAQAQELSEAAKDWLLRTKDELHRWCLNAYAERIRQAIQGESLATPMNPSLLESLEKFSKRDRFKLDRLRQASRILDPEHSQDSFLRYHQGFQDELARELESLKAITDSVLLAEQFTRIKTNPSNAEEGYRIARAGLALAPRMGPRAAEGVLEQVANLLAKELPLDQRLVLLEESFKVAGHFDLTAWTERLGNAFRELLDLMSRTLPEVVLSLESFAGEGLQSLRRFGMRAEMALLLDSLEELTRPLAADSSGPMDRAKSLALLAGIAGGRFLFEQEQKAWALLDDVRDALFLEELSELQQTQLTKAYIKALGLAPPTQAGERLGELFQELRGIHDAFSTGTHFSLSQLGVAEALVLSVSGDIGFMDPSLQKLLDEEEFHVRQRIHRDLRTAMQEFSPAKN